MAHRQNTAARCIGIAAPLAMLLAWLCACLPPGALASPRVARGQSPANAAAIARQEQPTDTAAIPVPNGVVVKTVHYTLPALTLADAHGQPVDLAGLFAKPDPVIVNFIFTSCPEICPVMTGTQLQLQRRLGGDTAAPRFVSITLDPEQDSPAVLAEYASRFGADWTFLTGRRTDVMRTLQAFDAWRGNKMNHAAVTLMRHSPDQPWTRVEGLAPVSLLADLWRSLDRR